MMKNKLSFFCAFCFLLITHTVLATSPVAVLRIGETYTEKNCVQIAGEQLSGQAFQQDALLTYNGYQYTVYYNQTRNVSIARRKLPFGSWETITFSYRNTVDDAHNTISMGICKNDGTIHLSYDHHNDDLHYCYSLSDLANDPENADWSVASFSANTNVMDKAVPNVTYPRFISMPDGNLLFECRFRWSGWGDSYLRKYDGATKKWTLIGRYVQGEDVTPDACAYINRMDYDLNGRLHASWCWRDDYGGGTNHDLFYGYSDDHGLTWHDKSGANTYTTQPMDPEMDKTTGSCMGQTKTALKLKDIGYNRGYINQESQATDSQGRVHILNSYMHDDAGTETNWSTSRTKSILHHHFVDTDGTLHHRYIKNNGNNVNSVRRSQIVIDSLDNAFVIANGAQVYAATAANNYNDWDLVSDVDNGRFSSEAQVDHTLLAEGVLSFVYMNTADGAWTVIDYLIDNPRTPNGSGLRAEYFSEDNCQQLISVEDNVLVGAGTIPANTRSIRYSGTFETQYAENYTMYLAMNAPLASQVFVDDIKVMFSKASVEALAPEYQFTFNAIASHKHNIVIEVNATASHSVSLLWNGARTPKQIVPAYNLYAEKKNDINTPEALNPPVLPGKVALDNTLSPAFNVMATNKSVQSITPFNPVGDYSIELKTKINTVLGRGLDVEARSKSGQGFRFSLDQTTVRNTANSMDILAFSLQDNSEYQTYRFAVSGSQVYVYCGQEYIGTTRLTEIKDILADDTESSAVTVGADVIGTWIGPSYPTTYGWSCSYSSLVWAQNNENTVASVRYLDAYHTLASGGTYTGQLLVLRWDVSNAGCTFFYPVTLEANTNYDLSFLYEWWNNGSNPTLNVGVSKTRTVNSAYQSQNYTVSTKQIIHEGVFNFTTQEAGEYYITFEGTTGTMLAAGGFSLKSRNYTPVLRIGKNYLGGNLNADIEYITYQDNAYAASSVDTYLPSLPEKAILPTTLQGSINLNATLGAKDIHTLSFNPTKDYSIEVSATVSSAVGRGLDIDMRDALGKGFRTALGEEQFLFAAPYANALELASVSPQKQIVRYAVSNDTVHIYKNQDYVNSFSLVSMGEMNAAGTAEVSINSSVNTDLAFNKVLNPKFEETTDNGAPAGWVSDSNMGGSPNPRVQVGNNEIPLSVNSNAAFMFRFDGNGGNYFAYPVQLAPNTVYAVSFDLIAWGDANLGKTFSVVISTSANGSTGIIASKDATTPSVRATANNQSLRFRTLESVNITDTYYLSFVKKDAMGVTAVTNVFVGEDQNPLNQLLFGKNYTAGAANINIDYIKVDETGAFAPGVMSDLPIYDNTTESTIKVIAYNTDINIIANVDINNIHIYDILGNMHVKASCVGQNFATTLTPGIYIVQVHSFNEILTTKLILK